MIAQPGGVEPECVCFLPAAQRFLVGAIELREPQTEAKGHQNVAAITCKSGRTDRG